MNLDPTLTRLPTVDRSASTDSAKTNHRSPTRTAHAFIYQIVA
jgi:hypothetical protein